MVFKEKLGVSIVERYPGVTESLVAHGIHYMEVRVVKGNDPDLIRRLIGIALNEKRKSGIKSPTVHLPQMQSFDISQTDEELRLKALENQKMILDICLPVEPEIVVIHPSAPGEVPREEASARKAALIRSLKEFCPYCKALGLKVAVENLTGGSMVQTSDDLLEIVEAVGDNIGICFDVNHLLTEPITDFIRKAGKHIITMHVSDNDGIKERHFFPGDGVIDWKGLFSELKNINYDSYIIAECGVLANFPDTISEFCEKWRRLHA